jgi:hypothetical protein
MREHESKREGRAVRERSERQNEKERREREREIGKENE